MKQTEITPGKEYAVATGWVPKHAAERDSFLYRGRVEGPAVVRSRGAYGREVPGWLVTILDDPDSDRPHARDKYLLQSRQIVAPWDEFAEARKVRRAAQAVRYAEQESQEARASKVIEILAEKYGLDLDADAERWRREPEAEVTTTQRWVGKGGTEERRSIQGRGVVLDERAISKIYEVEVAE